MLYKVYSLNIIEFNLKLILNIPKFLNIKLKKIKSRHWGGNEIKLDV